MGQRCISAIPHGHWQSSTFIAALRHESIEAPFLVEGPVDAELRAYTARAIAGIRASTEGKEGIGAFLEKRAPGWVAANTKGTKP